jgi:hypothetical protein
LEINCWILLPVEIETGVVSIARRSSRGCHFTKIHSHTKTQEKKKVMAHNIKIHTLFPVLSTIEVGETSIFLFFAAD